MLTELDQWAVRQLQEESGGSFHFWDFSDPARPVDRVGIVKSWQALMPGGILAIAGRATHVGVKPLVEDCFGLRGLFGHQSPQIASRPVPGETESGIGGARIPRRELANVTFIQKDPHG